MCRVAVSQSPFCDLNHLWQSESSYAVFNSLWKRLSKLFEIAQTIAYKRSDQVANYAQHFVRDAYDC